MIRTTAAAFVAAVCLPLTLAAQPAPAPSVRFNDYTVDVWRSGDAGLPQNNVSSIVRTDDGYLWIGTWNGLVRFDGVRFTAVPTPNVAITDLHKDRRGDVWITTDGGGVVRWSRGRLTSFTSAEGLSHDNATAVGEDAAGNIWVGTVSGFNVIAGDRITVVRPRTDDPMHLLNFASSFTLGPSGRLWIATRAGLCEARGLEVECLHVKVPEAGVWLRKIHEDRDGGLWLGSARQGLVRVLGTTVTRYTPCPGAPNCEPGFGVGDIIETANRGLWVGYRGDGGLNLFAGDSLQRALAQDAGLPRAPVQDLYEDEEGSLWIATDGSGLVRLRKNRVAVYTRAHGLASDYVTSMAEDTEGGVWAGANCGGASRLGDDGRFRVLLERDLEGGCAWSLVGGRDGSLWIGTAGIGVGLFRWKDGVMTHLHSGNGLSDNNILALHEDSQGVLWIGTDIGDVHRLHNGTLTTFGAKDGLLTGNASALVEDRQGRMWLGFSGRGLASYANGRIERVTPASGLTTTQISKLHVDSRGVLRVGTLDQGLFRLDGGRFVRYIEADGLQHLAIAQILEDADGHLWIGTSRGIVRLRRPDVDAFDAGRMPSLRGDYVDLADGMLTNETTGYRFHPSGLRSRDGRLWFATINGLVMIDPAAFPLNPVPPPVLVERARIDGREIAVGDGSIQVPAGTRSLDLEYTAFSMMVPQRVRFRYRLVGYDDAWRDAGARRTAFYSRLPPAEYTFEVMAANNDGLWNTTPAAVRLVVAPFWWEHTGVRLAGLALLLAATALAVMGAYRMRVRQVFARNAELETRVTERTRELSVEHERLGVAHTRLEAAHDDLVATLNQLHLGVVLADRQGVVTLVNDVARTVLDRIGITSPEGRAWTEVLPLADIDRRAVAQAMNERVRLRDPIAVILQPADGRRFALEIDVKDDPRDPERRLFVLHDVSELYAVSRLFDETPRAHGLVGRSRAMQLVFKQINDVALVDTTVLIEGETGTGKELVAHAIHAASPRGKQPFIAVNCAGLTESLLASQLFGHRRGAFTGAVADQVGFFEAANGGTLFFDEVGDMPAGLQANLLRALQEREILRVGDSRARPVNVRVIAATHRNLASEVAAGRFRDDLFYRIRVARVALPALRERPDDVPLIAGAFVEEFARRNQRSVTDISTEAMDLLEEYAWPGNVRELRAVIETAVISCKRSVITALDLPPEIVAAGPTSAVAVDDGERARVVAAIDRAGGNRAAAARLLGIGRTTLYRKLKALGLEPAGG